MIGVYIPQDASGGERKHLYLMLLNDMVDYIIGFGRRFMPKFKSQES